MSPIHALALAAFMAVAIAPAHARAPTAAERARIEAALRGSGYDAWGDIELLDDWEIEGAKKPGSAQECDVTLDAKTLQVIDEDCE